jgi:hypothetical protein
MQLSKSKNAYEKMSTNEQVKKISAVIKQFKFEIKFKTSNSIPILSELQPEPEPKFV